MLWSIRKLQGRNCPRWFMTIMHQVQRTSGHLRRTGTPSLAFCKPCLHKYKSICQDLSRILFYIYIYIYIYIFLDLRFIVRSSLISPLFPLKLDFGHAFLLMLARLTCQQLSWASRFQCLS